MTTAARPTPTNAAHWYSRDGTPCHFVEKKDGSGTRPATLADARKNNWVPGVTTVLRILDKPALTTWLIEQSVLAVSTAPDLPGESIDAKIHRVLHVEKQQDQEAAKARDIGTQIHQAIEDKLNGRDVPPEMAVFLNPVLDECCVLGVKEATEQIVVGDGYAGKLDAAFRGDCLALADFKTTKKLPKESWPEHRLQLAAYAATFREPVKTCNVYISTAEPGKVIVCHNPPWQQDFEAFQHLLKLWQWLNNFSPATT